MPVRSVNSVAVASFAAPWSMIFLPDGRMLVTERPPTPDTLLNPVEPGRLRLVTQGGVVSAPIAGLPSNVGLLDIKLDPLYASNRRIYISFMERDPNAPRTGRDEGDARVDPAGLAVMRGTLNLDPNGGAQLTDVSVIWRQTPKIVSFPGSGEPGGRLAFSPDGIYLFVTAGDRQEFTPVQSLTNTLGKIIRIYPDGSIPSDNPYVGRGDALPEIWTLGHRNAYGLAFDAAGQLWENEMGPMGGDEFNLIQRTGNYGWPNVSYGDNYGGAPLPKPATGDGYAASAVWWTPVIAPSGMIFYTGTTFGDWRGDAIISGLQSKGLVRVRVTGTTASEVQRIDLGARIRSVTQGPDGALWVLEDQPSGRLLKLTPVF
ncbi:PQQ-dependent sugar dehydrogenase [Sphingomonas sp. Leaf357]|uniref:PQQ-dependent sugar dehydrogenase n=1 Tax=Sphingomonas sp. Leaf357 TaxID=1736350 RepID=UPI001F27BA5C|nr:PQQ-dependent sugar dehydrogenase [Sphingomonas sp. Leaf357]